MKRPPPSSRGASCVVVAAVLAACASACFDDGVDDGAVLYCSSDDDCPGDLRCDVFAHLCGDPARRIDTLQVSLSDDAVADDDVTITLVADVALDDAAPELRFQGGDPGATFVAVADNTATFVVAVDSVAPADGTYRLVEVALAAAGGQPQVFSVDRTLTVDRTAPLLSGLVSLSGPLSDLPPNNVLTLRVRANEQLATTQVLVSELPPDTFTCTEEPGLNSRCEGALAAGAVFDGDNLVTVIATDPAGNTSTATLTVDVDAAAPAVIAETVEVQIAGPSATSVVIGSTVTLDLVVSEELGAAPALILDAGPRVPFAIAQENGRAYRFARTIGVDDFRVGVHRFTIALADSAGHTAVVEVPLPAPFSAGVSFTDDVTSPCPVAADNPDPCIDHDGDGFFGAAGGCERATDCNDLDATVRPGAPEIPGDGVDNSCDDVDGVGDLAIDESVGVFVDPGAAVDGTGTRLSPFSRLSSARVAATAEGLAYIFLAAGEVDGNGNDEIEHHLIGGLDASSWRPSSERTTIFTAVDATFVRRSNAVVVRIASRQGTLVCSDSTTTWVDSDTDGLMFLGVRGWLVRTAGNSLVVASESANGTRLLESAFGEVSVDDGAADVLIDSSRIGSIDNSGGLTIANSAVSSRFARGTLVRTAVLDDFNSLGTLVVHSTIESSDGDIDVRLLDVRTDLHAVNTLLVRRNAADSVTVSAQGSFNFVLTGVVFDVPGGPTMRIGLDTTVDLQSGLTACGLRCRASAVFLDDAAVIVDDPLHNLTSGAGVDRAEDIWFLDGMPSSLVRDIDNQCRYVDVVDIGPNEIP